MTLAPLLYPPAAVQFHAVAALFALVAGGVMLMPEGTPLHRRVGTVRARVLIAVALSSFAIRSHGGFSAVHILSV